MATFKVKYIICGFNPKGNVYREGSAKLRLIHYSVGSQITFDSEDEALAAADGKFLSAFTILKVYNQ